MVLSIAKVIVAGPNPYDVAGQLSKPRFLPCVYHFLLGQRTGSGGIVVREAHTCGIESCTKGYWCKKDSIGSKHVSSKEYERWSEPIPTPEPVNNDVFCD